MLREGCCGLAALFTVSAESISQFIREKRVEDLLSFLIDQSDHQYRETGLTLLASLCYFSNENTIRLVKGSLTRGLLKKALMLAEPFVQRGS